MTTLLEPARERDCLDCGVPGAMKLQNVTRIYSTNVLLLYTCSACGARLTIPPKRSPLPAPHRLLD